MAVGGGEREVVGRDGGRASGSAEPRRLCGQCAGSGRRGGGRRVLLGGVWGGGGGQPLAAASVLSF